MSSSSNNNQLEYLPAPVLRTSLNQITDASQALVVSEPNPSNTERAQIYANVIYMILDGTLHPDFSLNLPASQTRLILGDQHPSSRHVFIVAHDRVSQELQDNVQNLHSTPFGSEIINLADELRAGTVTGEDVIAQVENNLVERNVLAKQIAKELVCTLMYFLGMLLKKAVIDPSQENYSEDVLEICRNSVNLFSTKVAEIVEEHGGWEQVILGYVNNSWSIDYESFLGGIGVGLFFGSAITFLVMRLRK